MFTLAAPKSAAALGKLFAAIVTQPRLPLAAMLVAKLFVEQAVGVAANAVAVLALPVTLPLRAPLKVVAVRVPPFVRLPPSRLRVPAELNVRPEIPVIDPALLMPLLARFKPLVLALKVIPVTLLRAPLLITKLLIVLPLVAAVMLPLVVRFVT